MISNKEQAKKYDIRERAFDFSKRILEISELLPETKVCEVLRIQLVKSGTSIGANLEESDGTITKRDFVNKVVIARKEAKETQYWLRLIEEKFVKKEYIKDDLVEINEIMKILSAIINKTRNKKSIL